MARKKVTETTPPAKSQAAPTPTKVIPLRTPTKSPASGALCSSAWGILQAAMDQLGSLQPRLIFLFLDVDKKLMGLHSFPYRPDRSISPKDAAAIVDKSAGACREIVVLLGKDITEDRQLKPHQLRENYCPFFDGLKLAFLLGQRDAKLTDLYIVSGAMMFSVQRGTWFSFLPYPGGVNTPERPSEPSPTGVKSLRLMTESVEEDKILRVYRRLSPMQRRVVLDSLYVAEELQSEYENVVSAVLAGQSLTDDQANTWAWLRDKVIARQF